MAFYLVIRNESTINRYLCETTYNKTPYLKMSTNGTGGYLNLTTASTTGMRLNVSNVTTSSSVSTTESQYETTGYSGVSSRESTSGYSGIGTRITVETTATSYSGMYSTAPNYNQGKVTSNMNYSTIVSESSSTNYNAQNYQYSVSATSNYTKRVTNEHMYRASIAQTTFTLSSGISNVSTSHDTYAGMDVIDSHGVTATYKSSNAYSQTSSSSQNTMTIGAVTYSVSYGLNNKPDIYSIYGQSTSYTLSKNGANGQRTVTLDNDQDCIYHTRHMTFTDSLITEWGEYASLETKFTLRSTTATEDLGAYVSLGYRCTSEYIYYSKNELTSSRYYNTGTIDMTKQGTGTETETYRTTSSEIGSLSSVTALTRSSNYSTASIDIGNLSSTSTASITTTRSSSQSVTGEFLTHYRPRNTETITITKTINKESSYYTGIKRYNGTTTLLTTRESECELTTGYSGKIGSTWENIPAYQTSASSDLSMTTSSYYSGVYLECFFTKSQIVPEITYLANITSQAYISNTWTTYDTWTVPTGSYSFGGISVSAQTGNYPTNVKTVSNILFPGVVPLDEIGYVTINTQGVPAVDNTWIMWYTYSKTRNSNIYKMTMSTYYSLYKYDSIQPCYSGFKSYSDTVYTYSDTTNSMLSSTTALTKLGTCSSAYTLSPGDTYTMSSHRMNNKMSSIGFETRESTSYTETFEAIKETKPPSENNQLEVNLDAGFYI